MSSTDRILVLADDLTGANDTAVTFADAGFETLLLHDSDISSLGAAAEVLAISADSRPIGTEAEARTFNSIERAKRLGVSRLYLKIDSTMRGSVEFQISGALNAWKSSHHAPVALVCPAYPEMGRRVAGGILTVNGVPASDTPSGRDPVCPVRADLMTDLIPGSLQLSPRSAADLVTTVGDSSSEIFVIDAQTDEELAEIARAAILLGERAILVGSAGLAQALSKLMTPQSPPLEGSDLARSKPPLIVVSSIHDTSQTQVDTHIGSHLGVTSTVFSPHPAQLLNDAAMTSLSQQVVALAQLADRALIIRANPSKVKSSLTNVELARDFAEKLSVLALRALESDNFSSVVLVGGDGAAQLIERLGTTQLRILRSVAPGVPLAEAVDGRWPGLRVVTKSGGFGEENLISEITGKLWKA